MNVGNTVVWSLGGLYGILIVASLVVAILGRLGPGKDYSELTLRVKSWWVMVSIFTLAMILSRGVSIVFFAFISFLALKEYLSIIPTRRADRRAGQKGDDRSADDIA